ncbi:type VII secretion target [Streptomyces syringium]|uniref:type VII secretion target n=1 Tax=Streptomyces syringium TaxID=76729 RepID=UPI00364CBF10
MALDEEWDRRFNPHRYDGSGKPTGEAMRLASSKDATGGAGGAGPRRLRVSPSFLRDKAGKADEVRAAFRRTDDSAVGSGGAGSVAEGLKGFRSSPAFAVFLDRWRAQMNELERSLQHEVAAPLRAAARDFHADDQRTRGTLDRFGRFDRFDRFGG